MASKVIMASGLDAGSRRTRCVVCVVENGRIEVKGYAEIDSLGWANGTIIDHGAVTECIHWVLREAERTSERLRKERQPSTMTIGPVATPLSP